MAECMTLGCDACDHGESKYALNVSDPLAALEFGRYSDTYTASFTLNASGNIKYPRDKRACLHYFYTSAIREVSRCSKPPVGVEVDIVSEIYTAKDSLMKVKECVNASVDSTLPRRKVYIFHRLLTKAGSFSRSLPSVMHEVGKYLDEVEVKDSVLVVPVTLKESKVNPYSELVAMSKLIETNLSSEGT